MRQLLIALLGLTFCFASCGKPPIYDDTPTITWGSFSQDTIDQLTGVVKVSFDFTDGDGDLGRNGDPNDHILIIDTRRTPNDTSFYKIPTIAQQGVVSGISGTITVTMSQLCAINPNNPLFLCQTIPNYYDPVVYKIQIRDLAGRWSNQIQTDTLYIKAF